MFIIIYVYLFIMLSFRKRHPCPKCGRPEVDQLPDRRHRLKCWTEQYTCKPYYWFYFTQPFKIKYRAQKGFTIKNHLTPFWGQLNILYHKPLLSDTLF